MSSINNLQFVKEHLEEPEVRNIDNNSQVFYKYDYKKELFQLITPTVEKLLGYNIDELNKIGFKSLVRNQLVERKTSYSLNHSSNNLHIEENFITYLIETHNGESKWIEDNSFIICDEFNQKVTRYGILKDVGAYIREEKLRQIISEILEASNSEKNLSDLFKFIHTCIKKLMKADNFYIAYYQIQHSDFYLPSSLFARNARKAISQNFSPLGIQRCNILHQNNILLGNLSIHVLRIYL